ncbi:MAG: oligosaccharide repeat unit polymerase [Dorea sp.]|jgi:oligosaccharide repeat unit polymerase|nr:oligosaccharide repeat unit polymerase [Dorea sp.]
MRVRSNTIMEYGTYMLMYLASYVSSLAGLPVLSGILLVIEALYLYVHLVRQAGSLIELRAWFTLAWVGGQGIACMQLSRLQTNWHYMTWIAFCLIYLGFGIGYEWGQQYGKIEEAELKKDAVVAGRLYICIVLLAAVSVLCFVCEMAAGDYIPLFAGETHGAYYYQATGLHYFTISCILIPAITVLYVKVSESVRNKRLFLLIPANILAVGMPFLYVSRFQLVFVVGFAVVTFIMVNKKLRLKTMGILLGLLIPVYILTVMRSSYDVSYLNQVFEMKYGNMPLILSQPYMYIANNFENFNYMVVNLTEHTWGLRLLYPLFALTGLKRLFPTLAASEVFLIKPELTTLTMFYDAYYDFGVFGTFFFVFMIGMAAKVLMNAIKKDCNPVVYLFYGQMAIYLGLAFFTTWFSNPTTWFWLILTGIMYWFIGHDRSKHELRKRTEDKVCAQESAVKEDRMDEETV